MCLVEGMRVVVTYPELPPIGAEAVANNILNDILKALILIKF